MRVRAAEAALARGAAVWERQARLAAELRAALVRRDVPGVAACARQQQAAAPECEDCRAAAALALQALAWALGLAPASPWSEILTALDGIDGDECVPRLRAAATAVSAAAVAAGRLMAANTVLLRQGVAFTSFALRCLTAAGPVDPGYTAAGQPRRIGLRRVLDTTA